MDRIVNISVIEVASPQRQPFISEEWLAEFAPAVRSALANPAIETIVVTAPEGIFLAGADVRYFARCLLSGDLDRLLRFTRDAQQLFGEIERSAKPVVAWVNGPAIGAGLELALACHKIVAGPRAKFSFPETGLGIYPGLGGTQRTSRRIGAALAKWMIFAGPIVPADHAAEIRLVDAVVPAAGEAREVLDRLATRPPPAPRSERFTALEAFFAAHRVATLCDPALALPADPQLARTFVQVRSKAPLALRLAETLIDEGLQLPLADGLELEFSRLRDIFSTEDARSGILSLGTQRVEFVGR